MEIKFKVYEVSHKEDHSTDCVAKPVTPYDLFASEDVKAKQLGGLVLLKFGKNLIPLRMGDIVTVSF